MADDPTKALPVGLSENRPGVHFRCGTCEFYDGGTCHNKHPSLDGTQVEARWCCNLYHHTGMKVIVRG